MEGKIKAMTQHDWEQVFKILPVLVSPLTAYVSLSRAVSPSAPCSFIYKKWGWVLRISSHFKTLLFAPESCYLLALWVFQRKTSMRSLFQIETSFIFSLSLVLPFPPFSLKSPLLFQVSQCYFSCCPWLCLSFLLTCSPGHSYCLLQCQSQRKLGCKSCELWCWVRTDK